MQKKRESNKKSAGFMFDPIADASVITVLITLNGKKVQLQSDLTHSAFWHLSWIFDDDLFLIGPHVAKTLFFALLRMDAAPASSSSAAAPAPSAAAVPKVSLADRIDTVGINEASKPISP